MEQMIREAGLEISITLLCLEVDLFGSEVLCLTSHRGRSKTTVQTPHHWRRNFAASEWEPGGLNLLPQPQIPADPHTNPPGGGR